MAFLSKVGNILRQTVNKQINSEVRSTSIFASIRCMSTSTSPKLFVGGLSFNTDEGSLRQEFAKYGEVVEARIIYDRETGRSRGFGFVTFTNVEEASSALQAVDGKDLDGRRVRVNYANERPRTYGGGYGGAGGGGGYGGGSGPYGGGGYGDRGGYGSGAGGGYGDNSGITGGYGGGYNPGGNYGGPAAGGNYTGGGDFSSSNYGGNSYGVGGSSSGFGRSGSSYGTDGSFGAAGNGGSSATLSNAGGFGGSNTSDESSGGNFADVGFGGSTDSSELGYGSDRLGNDESSSVEETGNDVDSLEGNYRDDENDTDEFAKKA